MNIGQALLLGQLARYFTLPCELRDDVETRSAYIRGTCKFYIIKFDIHLFLFINLVLILLSFLTIFLHAHAFLVGQMIGMLVRIMMTSAIYNKVS